MAQPDRVVFWLTLWSADSWRFCAVLRGEIPPATGAIVRDNLLELCREQDEVRIFTVLASTIRGLCRRAEAQG